MVIFILHIAPLSKMSEIENVKLNGLKGSMFDWEHKTMTFKEAKHQAVKTFFELESSGIIYHGDNLDMLLGLDPKRRKEFIARRHEMAKKAAMGQIVHKEDLLEYFKKIFINKN